MFSLHPQMQSLFWTTEDGVQQYAQNPLQNEYHLLCMRSSFKRYKMPTILKCELTLNAT